MKSAISSHFAKFGTFPRATFLTLRFKPTGAAVTAKCRRSISFVSGLYENSTHRLIVDRFTVAKLIVGNIFWNVCAISFRWFPSPVKLFRITCKNLNKINACLRDKFKSKGVIKTTYQGWVFECGIVKVLFFHRRQNIAGECELMNFEYERWSFGQSSHLERQLIGGFIQNAHMRHMKHSGQTDKIFDFVFAAFA